MLKTNIVDGGGFANLDLLRAVAVTVVFVSHLVHKLTGSNIPLIIQLGHVGVLMFFVHTALVLMWSGERDLSRSGGGGWFRAFYVKRAFRIYPLSMLCVLIAYCGRAVLTAHPGSVGDLIANLTLTQNLFQRNDLFAVIWTLPLEVQMYVALPLLLVFLKPRHVGWTVATIALSVPVALAQLRFSPRFEVLSYAPVFLGGVLAWRLMAQQKQGQTRKLPGWLWPLSFTVCLVVWILAVLTLGTNPVYGWIFGWALGITIPLFAEIPWVWVKFCAKEIATYSYGIYLCHVPLQELCIGHLPGPMAIRVPASIALTLAVAAALYRFIEAPGIAYGKRLERYLLSSQLRDATLIASRKEFRTAQ